MPEYQYWAVDAQGRVEQGRTEAPTREAALGALSARKLTPTRLELLDGNAAAAAPVPAARQGITLRLKSSGAPDRTDVHAFTSELSIMLRAGLPLDRALRVLIGMSRKPTVIELYDDLLKAVKSGKGLSQALQPHRELFGEFYINMVRAGEAGGQLSEALARLAEHLERVKALRESVISALIYPAILVVVAVLSVMLMLGFVVPRFEALFNDMGDALPMATRVIVGLGHFVADWGWLLVLVAAGVALLLRRWFASPEGRLWRDARMLKLPVLGNIVGKYEITRFCRSMGTLLGSGVPIVGALKIATETIGNVTLREAMAGVGPKIKQGGRMGEALTQTGLFTPLALNMIRLGEETGRLDELLIEVARVHDGEVQSSVKRALTLIEPVLILTLGAVIAAIIVSILTGILSVNDLAN